MVSCDGADENMLVLFVTFGVKLSLQLDKSFDSLTDFVCIKSIDFEQIFGKLLHPKFHFLERYLGVIKARLPQLLNVIDGESEGHNTKNWVLNNLVFVPQKIGLNEL